ncbi:MgtC/SapB family protein [Flavobacterium tistrianum]|uniref:MgtC/SapB family protein n=1 Tax=Flavobacterium tistrianum TaxID=1685414 RepID=UPI000DAF19A3|nr:MgtC/SapB family protein [Flavobacterium tistrianum]KAF2342443.1 MgtC/SapB family protein [Flavobacterium tistrianum]
MDVEIIIKLLLATFWGALIGAEREYKGKAAGLRTTIMISVGACFFTLMSEWIGGPGNPDRIASNIVTGLGFLCAGVIFRSDSHVSGITTAATIWSVAAVSMGVGAGYYFASACAAIMIIIILTMLTVLQDKIDLINEHKTLRITFKRSDNGHERCKELFSTFGVNSKLMTQRRNMDHITLEWQIHGSKRAIESLYASLLVDPIFEELVL